jgi:hypothetical protein
MNERTGTGGCVFLHAFVSGRKDLTQRLRKGD